MRILGRPVPAAIDARQHGTGAGRWIGVVLCCVIAIGSLSYAQVLRQLTDTPQLAPEVFHWEPDISRDGSYVLFVRAVAGHVDSFDLLRMATSGGEPLRLTEGVWTNTPTLSGDGTAAVFASGFDQGLWVVGVDEPVRRLVADQVSWHPALGKASDRVVFQLNHDLYGVALEDGTTTRILYSTDSRRKNPRVDYAGRWIVYHSEADPFGTNPDGSLEVFRIRNDGQGLQQLTDSTALLPDISADGGLVVYESSGDPAHHNVDGNYEIFLWRATTGATEQLTFTERGSNIEPRISGNGRYVYFVSTSPFFEPEAEDEALYRIDLWLWRLERVSGMPRGGGIASGTLRNNPGVAVDESGERVVFTGSFDGTGGNPDHSHEVFFADFTAIPKFEVSAAAPTVLSWDTDPRAAGYDVIRGDLANLQFTDDWITDLGPVVCLAQGLSSPSLDSGDSEDPAAGQGFFFLYRFTQGSLDGPGSWGRATWGFERVPSQGDCPD